MVVGIVSFVDYVCSLRFHSYTVSGVCSIYSSQSKISQKKLLTYPGIFMNINPVMNEQMIQQYFENLQKFSNNEWTSQQWYDYCAAILGQLMEEHKDIFIRLKNR